jgi:trehalose-6-phosphate synthase
VYSTAEAMHQALTMPAEERARRAEHLQQLIENDDITDWLCKQLVSLARGD